MTHTRRKLLVATVVLLGAVSYLAFAGAKKGWVYTVGVDGYFAKAEYRHQRTRLCGKVAAENLASSPAALTASFTLLGTDKTIPVVYRGVVPDLFKAGCEVVVEGQENAAGVFESDLLMTKCASKYEGHPTDGTHPKEIAK